MFKVNVVISKKTKAKKAAAFYMLQSLFPEVLYVIGAMLKKRVPGALKKIEESNASRT